MCMLDNLARYIDTLITFPRQQCSCERASKLRHTHTYFVCLVKAASVFYIGYASKWAKRRFLVPNVSRATCCPRTTDWRARFKGLPLNQHAQRLWTQSASCLFPIANQTHSIQTYEYHLHFTTLANTHRNCFFQSKVKLLRLSCGM